MCFCSHDNRRKYLLFIFLTFLVRAVQESMNDGFVESPMKFNTNNASNHFLSLLFNSQQLQTVTIKAIKDNMEYQNPLFHLCQEEKAGKST